MHLEQDLIGENVGSQDQTIAAFGGFNRIDFYPDDSIAITPAHAETPQDMVALSGLDEVKSLSTCRTEIRRPC